MSEPRLPVIDAAQLRRRPYNAGTGPWGQLRLMRAAFRNWLFLSIVRKLAGALRWPILLDRPIRIRTRAGDVLDARCRDMDGPIDVFAGGAYDLEFLDWSTVATVIDVGGHVGDFVVWVCRRTPARVLALEPNPQAFAFLERNVVRAGLGARVRSVEQAVAGTAGRRQLVLAQFSSASALARGGQAAAHGSAVPVAAVTLPELISGSDFETVDLLKVDIEGAEYEVFAATAAADMARVRRVVVECHELDGDRCQALAERLRGWGYQVAEERHRHQATLVAWR